MVMAVQGSHKTGQGRTCVLVCVCEQAGNSGVLRVLNRVVAG